MFCKIQSLNIKPLLAAISAAASFASATSAVANPSKPNTEALATQGIAVTYGIGADFLEYYKRPVYLLLAKTSSAQGRGGEGNWRAVGFSFLPIVRPDDTHEVVVFERTQSFSVDNPRYRVRADFRVQPRDIGTNTRPIDERGFNCGSVLASYQGRVVEPGYGLCTSAFSRRDTFATGALLVIAGPAGAGSFKRYDGEALASALISAGVPSILAHITRQRARITALDMNPEGATRKELNALVGNSIAAAWPHGTATPQSRAMLRATQEAAGFRPTVSMAYQRAMNDTLGAFPVFMPIGEGGATPEFDQAMEVAAQGATSVASRAFAQLPSDLEMCNFPALGAPPQPETIASNFNFTVDLGQRNTLAWRVACTSTRDEPLAFNLQPYYYRGSAAPLLANWRAEDGTLSVAMDGPNVVITNKSSGFVTLKAVSLHLAGKVTTVSSGNGDILLVPPNSQSRLPAYGAMKTIADILGSNLNDINFAPVAAPNSLSPTNPTRRATPRSAVLPLAPIVIGGFSFFYEADGSTKSLSNVMSLPTPFIVVERQP